MGRDDIITFSEILEIYGLGRRAATKLLNTKGCPVLPRKKKQAYRVVRSEFENWLKSQKR